MRERAVQIAAREVLEVRRHAADHECRRVEVHDAPRANQRQHGHRMTGRERNAPTLLPSDRVARRWACSRDRASAHGPATRTRALRRRGRCRAACIYFARMALETYDVAIVGGGPAGSTCASALVVAGARVAVLDRATFPRVKLCAGWLSAGIWDALALAPRDYTASGRGLWAWNTCHVHYRGRDHAVRGKGWFIRRYEFDDFLLARSGTGNAPSRARTSNSRDERRRSLVDRSPRRHADPRARYLVGAGGCLPGRAPALPIARAAARLPGAQLAADPAAIERTRLGRDGEPELLLFDDIGGYGWNVPKSGWLNVGCGTLDATAVHDAWTQTHEHLATAHHLPREAEPALEHLKGHSYYLFRSVHLERAARHRCSSATRSGLAHPITGEGILPPRPRAPKAISPALGHGARRPRSGDRRLPTSIACSPRPARYRAPPPSRPQARRRTASVAAGPPRTRRRARFRLDVLGIAVARPAARHRSRARDVRRGQRRDAAMSAAPPRSAPRARRLRRSARERRHHRGRLRAVGRRDPRRARVGARRATARSAPARRTSRAGGTAARSIRPSIACSASRRSRRSGTTGRSSRTS